MAPAPAPGQAAGPWPAMHLPKQLLGQQSPAPPCHQGVETDTSLGHKASSQIPPELQGGAPGMLQHLPGWECIGSKAKGPRLASVTQPVLATTPHSLLATITHLILLPKHPTMEGHPPLSVGHHHPPNNGHHFLLSLGHCHPPNTGHYHSLKLNPRHPSSAPTSHLPGVSHGSRDHQHRCPAVPTREMCSRTRAQIQPFSPQNCPGTGFKWENLRSGNSWLLRWQPPTREIAGLGAGMVTAGTTRWVPRRSKQVLQKTGGTL